MCPYDAITLKMTDLNDHGKIIRKLVATVNEALAKDVEDVQYLVVLEQ